MLVPTQRTMDLGQLKFGKPYSFIYTVQNSSDKVVKINRMIVGCTSCTKASTTQTTIKPGETGIINVTYTPGKTGKSKKNIQVVYDTDQILRLDFTANVQ